MKVKRSSSSIESARAFSVVRVRRGVRAAALAQAVEIGERQDVLDARALDLRALLLVLDEHADGARVLGAGTARRGASSMRRSGRRLRRRAPARSRRAPTRGSSGRGAPNESPFCTPSASRPFASSSTVRPASAHVTGCHSPSTSRRYAGPSRCSAMAFRQRFGDGCAALHRVKSTAPRRNVRGRQRIRPARIGIRWMRTTWNGSISFGLVNIPVGLAPATKPAARQADVSFRMLHRECGTPIKQKRWCPVHERDVELGRARARLGGEQGAVRHGRGSRARGDRAARHVAFDRDRPLRRGGRGRSGLLRPHVLPRPGRHRGRSDGRTSCCSRR